MSDSLPFIAKHIQTICQVSPGGLTNFLVWAETIAMEYSKWKVDAIAMEYSKWKADAMSHLPSSNLLHVP